MTALREALADYLAMRRAMGYRLARAEKLLGQFLTFLERTRGNATVYPDRSRVGDTPSRGSELVVEKPTCRGTRLCDLPAHGRPND